MQNWHTEKSMLNSKTCQNIYKLLKLECLTTISVALLFSCTPTF